MRDPTRAQSKKKDIVEERPMTGAQRKRNKNITKTSKSRRGEASLDVDYSPDDDSESISNESSLTIDLLTDDEELRNAKRVAKEARSKTNDIVHGFQKEQPPLMDVTS